MEWSSILAGAVIGIITAVFAYEYKCWRERVRETSDKKRQAVSLLRSELNKVITSWETFKKTEEMHVDPALSNFQYELEATARSLRNIASASEKLISKKILNETIEIAGKLTRLSQKKFYIDGGKSWNEFLELGDKIIKQCNELRRRLS